MNWDDFLGFVAAILILVALYISADFVTCNNKYSSFEHRWGILSGCQLNINGKWIPADAYYIKEDLTK